MNPAYRHRACVFMIWLPGDQPTPVLKGLRVQTECILTAGSLIRRSGPTEANTVALLAYGCRRTECAKHLATLLDDFGRFDRDIAIVSHPGVWDRRVTSYGEIAKLAGRFAALLENRGVVPGDRVLLWGENSAEWIAAYYGIVLRGALVVPLDAFGTTDFAMYAGRRAAENSAVGDPSLLRNLPIPWPRLAFDDWPNVLPSREAGPVTGLNPTTPLQIVFTSGTTGEPKGVVHTHGNVLASVAPIEQGAKPYMRYEPLVHPLRILHTLPLSHVFGQTMGLWVPAIFAAEVHFESRLVAPRLIESIKKEKISVLAAVPRVMALLKSHLESSVPGLQDRVESLKKKKLGAARRWWLFRDVHRALGLKFWALISGGGALTGSLEQFWNALGLVVVQGYGMTETTALITLNHPFHVASGTIGKPLPGREVKIGPDGEVLVRGPMISNVTWSGGTLRTLKDEWLATGDIAEKQATGELKFLGRKSEVIVTAAGVNIHPEDLESALEAEPGVEACTVVPIQTSQGPEPFAVLALRGSPFSATVAVKHANDRLAEFQQIRRWAIWPEPDLPRTSTGKIKRKAVSDWVAASQNGAGKKDQRKWKKSHGPTNDLLLVTLAEISGETATGGDNELRLNEDFHLDSLGTRSIGSGVIEERLGVLSTEGEVDRMQTLGELRKFISAAYPETSKPRTVKQAAVAVLDPEEAESTSTAHAAIAISQDQVDLDDAAKLPAAEIPKPEPHVYPHWPWWKPVAFIRSAFLELCGPASGLDSCCA